MEGLLAGPPVVVDSGGRAAGRTTCLVDSSEGHLAGPPVVVGPGPGGVARLTASPVGSVVSQAAALSGLAFGVEHVRPGG